MNTTYLLFIFALLFALNNSNAQNRTVKTLDNNWQFINQEVANAEKPETSTTNWKTVSVPHDWAIKGPFDKTIDAQLVKVQQDMDKEAKMRTGRTGALPHIGIGWYRKTFELPEFKKEKKHCWFSMEP